MTTVYALLFFCTAGVCTHEPPKIIESTLACEQEQADYVICVEVFEGSFLSLRMFK